MASKMTKRGSEDNEVVYEFMCDTVDDLDSLDRKYITLGSIAIVLQGAAGLEVYMANSSKEWIQL